MISPEQEKELRELLLQYVYPSQLNDVIPQIQQILSENTEKVCEWKNDGMDEDDSTWKTSCGNMFSFINGGLEENCAVYCQYCGGKIKEVQPLPQSPKEG